MTRDEAILRIQEGLSFRTDLIERIKRALEEARRDLEMGKTLPWFLLEEDEVLTLPIGQQDIALPTGFIRTARFDRLRYLPLDSTSYLNIPWKGFDEASIAYSGATASGPQVAVIRKATIRIFPAADREYSLLWTYYKNSSSLDAGDVADNAWLVNVPDAIIGEAGWRVAMDTENQVAAQKFDTLRSKGRAAVLAEEIEREAAGGPLIMGANN